MNLHPAASQFGVVENRLRELGNPARGRKQIRRGHDDIVCRDEQTFAALKVADQNVPASSVFFYCSMNEVSRNTHHFRWGTVHSHDVLPSRSNYVAFRTVEGDLRAACKQNNGDSLPYNYRSLCVPSRNFCSSGQQS